MTFLARMALRSLWVHPARTVATVLGIGIGVASVLATTSVGANVRANLKAELDTASGPADLILTPGVGGRAVIDVSEAVALLTDVDGVEHATPVLSSRIEPLRDAVDFDAGVVPGLDTGFQVTGRDTARTDLWPGILLEGRWPQNAERTLALSATFAGLRDLAVGDDIAFATRFGSIEYRIVGLMDGTIGYGASNGGRVAIVPLEVLQADLRLEGRASFVDVHVADDVMIREVLERIQATTDERFTVGYPAGSGDVAGGIVDTLQSGLMVLAVTLLALGGFLAYNTFAASVVERTRAFATMRTIAFRRRDVLRMATIESAIVAVLGTVTGLLMGLGLAWILTSINGAGLGFEVRVLVIPSWAWIAASTTGIAVALGAGAVPAWSASRSAPRTAIVASETPPLRGWQGATGVAAMGAAVALAVVPWPGSWALFGAGASMAAFAAGTSMAAPTLLGPIARLLGRPLVAMLGASGRLGIAFAERNSVRNGVAIATVVVGTGLVVGVGAMVGGIQSEIRTWVDTTVVGDLFVTSPTRFPADFAERAQGVAGIDQASGVAIRVVRFEDATLPRGRSIALVLVDPKRFDPVDGFGAFRYVEGDASSALAALRSPTGILASSTMRERFGVRQGDRVSLRTVDGFESFEVGAVVVDFTGGGETFVASIDALERFGGGVPDLYVLTVDEGVETVAATERLLDAFPQLFLDVTSNEEYRRSIVDLSNRTFATTNTLLVLAIVLAGLGVTNTLGMNLATRSRDLGVLRTLGVPRSGITKIVLAEGLLIVSVGSALGVGFGVILGTVVTSGAAALTGYVIEPVVPWTLVLVAILASPGVGLVASFVPARRAARLQPIDALRVTA